MNKGNPKAESLAFGLIMQAFPNVRKWSFYYPKLRSWDHENRVFPGKKLNQAAKVGTTNPLYRFCFKAFDPDWRETEERDSSGFQPFVNLGMGTWGVAPGWYGGTPLALKTYAGDNRKVACQSMSVA